MKRLLCFCFLLFLCPIVTYAITYPTPLQTWVWAEDVPRVYGFKVVSKVRNDHSTTYFVNLTSCRWLTANDTNQPIWWHWVELTIPDKILDTKHAGIYADGGGNGEQKPAADLFGVVFAETLGIPFAHLHQIPNQPLYFTAEKPPKRRTEDAAIAYSWLHFLKNPKQPEWLIRLPMVKSVVKCMDMMQELLPQLNATRPEKFFIAGASKRGWTTWLVPAVDDRVAAIIPMVMPILNMHQSLQQMWQSLGEWTFAFKDYVDLHVTDYLNTIAFEAMAEIIDPINYLPYLKQIPKYMIVSCGDEFFLPDSPRNFYPLLQKEGGESLLRMAPNADHSTLPLTPKLVNDIMAFSYHVMNNLPRPTIKEQLIYSNDTAGIIVWPSDKPSSATLWQASTWNKSRRDFRLINCTNSWPNCFQPIFWIPTTLKASEDGSYSAYIRAPSAGWIGFVIQLSWPSQITTVPDIDYTVTSQVNIVPDRYPFAPFVPSPLPLQP